MRCLRENSAPLVTILDVLIHDPLYRWMLSPKDARRKQRDDDAAAAAARDDLPEGTAAAPDNQAAERALFRVKQKLQGYEDATDVLSVEGQVTHLVADATDPDNLAVLFPGWGPWL